MHACVLEINELLTSVNIDNNWPEWVEYNCLCAVCSHE